METEQIVQCFWWEEGQWNCLWTAPTFKFHYGLTIFETLFSGICWIQEFWRKRDPSYMISLSLSLFFSNACVMPSLSHQNRIDFSKAPGPKKLQDYVKITGPKKLQRNQHLLLVMNALLQQSNVVCWKSRKSPFVTRQQEMVDFPLPYWFSQDICTIKCVYYFSEQSHHWFSMELQIIPGECWVLLDWNVPGEPTMSYNLLAGILNAMFICKSI